MKPKMKLINNPNTYRNLRIRAKRKNFILFLTPAPRRIFRVVRVVTPKTPWITWIFQGFQKLLSKLAIELTRSREVDERLRQARAEQYAKYGFYFRDRF